MAKINPFSYVNSITYSKIHLMETTEEEEAYSPFLTNRALSYFYDTVMNANDMNMYPNVDKRLQYEFFLNKVRERKRYEAWGKRISNDSLELVKRYYGFSNAKAAMALSILTPQQLSEIKTKLDTGGEEENERSPNSD